MLHLRQDRRRFELEYTRMLDPGRHAQLEYRYEHRDGRRVAGGMIGSNGGTAHAYATDITDPAAIATTAEISDVLTRNMSGLR